MMTEYSTGELAAFVHEETPRRGAIQEDTRLQADLGVYGDDMCELLTAYADQFKVDMSGYLWYFHTGEEGSGANVGAIFFDPPYRRVKEIPITVAMLRDFANSGTWAVNYPEHSIPKRRIDIAISQLLLVLFVLWLVVLLVWKYV